MLSLPLLSMSPMSSFPPNPPLWSHTLQIIPSSTHSSKQLRGLWMALIFLLILLLPSVHAIATTKVGSHRMSWLQLHSTCTFATYSVVGREVLLIGGSFMMHAFMTWSFQLAGITLQMQAIPSVMHLWCHSVAFGITSGSGKVVVCSMY